MKLPKIPNDHLTPELREIVGDGDLEFESIVDPMDCLLYTSPSPRDYAASRMPSSA